MKRKNNFIMYAVAAVYLVLVFYDVLFQPVQSDYRYVLLISLYGLSILFWKVNVIVTFSICVCLFVLLSSLYLLGSTFSMIDTAAIWFFLFFIITIIQLWKK